MNTRLRHEAAVFDSTEHMLHVVVPFLDEATAAGTPAVVRFGEEWAARLRDRVADPGRVDFVGGADDENPIRAVRAMNEAAQGHLEAGAPQIRLVGGVPDSAMSSRWAWEQWARYEAAFNEMYADLPAVALCCYPAWPAGNVHDDIAATHPRLVGGDGARENSSYVDPRRFVADRNPAPAERLDEDAPALELHDPHPGIAREAVRRLAERAHLADGQVEDLVLGANEVFTNAFLHGSRPVELRGWVADDELLLSIRDHGVGVDDPFVGMLQPPADRPEPGGYGVWLARMCSDLVTLRRDPDGFTVRMTARAR